MIEEEIYMRSMKVVPGSEAEQYFMQLLNEVGVKHESVICRIGEIFDRPYNEYLISNGLFKVIQEHIQQKKNIEARA
jgi:hypothetical protein